MSIQTGIGHALAELVKRLSPEEKQEFARWLSWDELEALRRERQVSNLVEETRTPSARRVGDPRVYVSTTPDGLALELPVACIVPFVKHLPALLSVSQVEVYLRKNGKGQELRVGAEAFADFLETHQDAFQERALMMEFGDETLVSGGGGCMFLTLEEASVELRRRLGTEALQACGFDYQFMGDSFTATVWDDELEVLDQ